ncbi:hypothetical protein [Duganella sp.]|uniref:hypothetical protein n=1 Tax=Duganella sp. TaxID=1904440 RepID=UPI0031D3FF86
MAQPNNIESIAGGRELRRLLEQLRQTTVTYNIGGVAQTLPNYCLNLNEMAVGALPPSKLSCATAAAYSAGSEYEASLNRAWSLSAQASDALIAQYLLEHSEKIQNAQAEIESAVAAQIKEQKRERRRKAVNLIAGLWKDREGGPIDGVEYQDKMRASWTRNT